MAKKYRLVFEWVVGFSDGYQRYSICLYVPKRVVLGKVSFSPKELGQLRRIAKDSNGRIVVEEEK